MLNGTRRTPSPQSGPECASFAPLLPVLEDLSPQAQETVEARAHLATCAYCRAQRGAYDRFDEALRRHFGPEASPFLTTEQIMQGIRNDLPDGAPIAENPDSTEGTASAPAPPSPISVVVSRPAAPRRSRRVLSAAVPLAAVLLIALLASLIYATRGHSTGPTHQGDATPTVVPVSQTSLVAVGMDSPDDGWAVGSSYPCCDNGDHAYLLHYTGGQWVEVQTDLPAQLVAVGAAIKMLSATNGWIVGAGIAHYDGSTWRMMQESGSFRSIAAISSSNIWTGGENDLLGGSPMILHYDGSTWTQQPTPVVLANAYTTTASISMVSADEGWAAGTAQTPEHNGDLPPTGFILHFVGGTWHLAATLPHIDLRTISMGSSSDGWAGGELETLYPESGPGAQTEPSILDEQASLWHFTGGQWQNVTWPGYLDHTAPAGTVGSITMFSAAEGWMVTALGDPGVQPTDGARDVRLAEQVLHYANGHWAEVQRPLFENRRIAALDPSNGIAFVSPSEFWIVGTAFWWTGAPGDPFPAQTPTVMPMIAHYTDGVWAIYED